MEFVKRIEADLKTALKAGRKEEISVLRLILAEVRNEEKEKRRSLEEGEAVQILRSGVKKRKEAIGLFRTGGRTDLVEKEAAEIKILEGYLPAALSEEELSALVEEAIAESGVSSVRDMGKVMKWVMSRIEGRADGSEVSRLARAKLASLS